MPRLKDLKSWVPRKRVLRKPKVFLGIRLVLKIKMYTDGKETLKRAKESRFLQGRSWQGKETSKNLISSLLEFSHKIKSLSSKLILNLLQVWELICTRAKAEIINLWVQLSLEVFLNLYKSLQERFRKFKKMTLSRFLLHTERRCFRNSLKKKINIRKRTLSKEIRIISLRVLLNFQSPTRKCWILASRRNLQWKKKNQSYFSFQRKTNKRNTDITQLEPLQSKS